MAGQSEWLLINKVIEDKIARRVKDFKIYVVEVIESTGDSVKVKYFTSEEDKEPLEGIPVLQNKYEFNITQPGDLGLLIDVGQNIDTMLKGLKGLPILNCPYFIFIPFLKFTDYTTAASGNDGLHKVLYSPTLKSSIVLGDDGLVITQVESDITITSPNLAITNEEASNLTTKALSINASESAAIESAAITIKGQDPIDFGTSQSLGAVLGEICDALSGFMTVPTSPGAPAAADPGFVAKISAAKSKLAQILKS